MISRRLGARSDADRECLRTVARQSAHIGPQVLNITFQTRNFGPQLVDFGPQLLNFIPRPDCWRLPVATGVGRCSAAPGERGCHRGYPILRRRCLSGGSGPNLVHFLRQDTGHA